jgi:two-component system chemotaxis sensor kinase CheA
MAQKESHSPKESKVRQKLEAIGEKKIQLFIKSARGLMNKYHEATLAKDKDKTQMAQSLYRCLHTLKGNARTFNFDDLVKMVHEEESHLDIFLKGQGEFKLEQATHFEKLINQEIEEYAIIASELYSNLSQADLGLDQKKKIMKQAS